MLNLLDYTLDELQNWMKENNESAFRAKQVFSWIYKKVYNFNDMNNIPKSLKEKLENSFIIDMPKIEHVYESAVDGTKKILLALLTSCALVSCEGYFDRYRKQNFRLKLSILPMMLLYVM